MEIPIPTSRFAPAIAYMVYNAHMFNITPADALAANADRASAGVILTRGISAPALLGSVQLECKFGIRVHLLSIRNCYGT